MITKYDKFINEAINVGSHTNKGKVLFIDTPYKTSGNYYDKESGEWKHDPSQKGLDAEVTVKTDKGWFKLSELVPVEKTDIAPNPEGKPVIEFSDLMKVDIRVCMVKSADKIKGKDRLLSLVIDTGEEDRNVITNIGSTYTPEQLVGKKFAFVLNLKPMKMSGVLSNGMIVVAEHDKKPYLVEIDSPIGSKLI